MPELFLQARRSGSATAVSTPYGNEFPGDNPPGEEPFAGAWNPEMSQVRYPQYPRTFLFKKKPYWPTPAVSEESQEVLRSGLKEDAFTQADLLDREEDKVQELISRIMTLPSISCRKLANRLHTLFNDAKEEDPTSIGIAIGSIFNFYNFFRLQSNLKCPTISLTPEYNIYASWRAERNRVFSVHFLPSGDIRFVVFKPNDRHPERQIRLSGTATTDILKETVAPYGVWDWISQ